MPGLDVGKQGVGSTVESYLSYNGRAVVCSKLFSGTQRVSSFLNLHCFAASQGSVTIQH